jgi:DNA-binding NtrC family response regulator
MSDNGLVRQKRVLIVDDSKQICGVIAKLLHSVEMRPAYDMAEALTAAKSETFDMFLLDIYLPDGTGTDLLPLLRKEAPETPALFITTAPDFSTEEARSLGALGLIRKDSPRFVEDLLEISNKVLGY